MAKLGCFVNHRLVKNWLLAWLPALFPLQGAPPEPPHPPPTHRNESPFPPAKSDTPQNWPPEQKSMFFWPFPCIPRMDNRSLCPVYGNGTPQQPPE